MCHLITGVSLVGTQCQMNIKNDGTAHLLINDIVFNLGPFDHNVITKINFLLHTLKYIQTQQHQVQYFTLPMMLDW